MVSRCYFPHLKTRLVCTPNKPCLHSKEGFFCVQTSLVYKLHGFRLVFNGLQVRRETGALPVCAWRNPLADSAGICRRLPDTGTFIPLRSSRFTLLRPSVMLQLMPQFITFNSMNGRK